MHRDIIIQGRAKGGLQLWICKILLIKYCIIFHINKPIFAPPCICKKRFERAVLSESTGPIVIYWEGDHIWKSHLLTLGSFRDNRCNNSSHVFSTRLSIMPGGLPLLQLSLLTLITVRCYLTKCILHFLWWKLVFVLKTILLN